jgi:deazaflavin-dependent oxidoreductase (nitroreductase family)
MDKPTTDDPLAFMRDHIRRYRASNGADGYDFNGVKVLLLDTVGARSGQPRTAALLYAQHGDAYAVVASRAGSPTPPAWFRNLQAQPEASIQVKDIVMPVRARVADADEQTLLWPRLVAIFPNFEAYQARAGRTLPIVLVEPRPPV